MAITSKTNQKRLICSDHINVVIDEDPSIEFDIEGLNARLNFKVIPSNSDDKTQIKIDTDGGVINIYHSMKMKSDNKSSDSGMLIPLALASRINGDKIYITWSARAKFTIEGALVLQVTYSFYEGGA